VRRSEVVLLDSSLLFLRPGMTRVLIGHPIQCMQSFFFFSTAFPLTLIFVLTLQKIKAALLFIIFSYLVIVFFITI
jgi:hypothetical protein